MSTAELQSFADTLPGRDNDAAEVVSARLATVLKDPELRKIYEQARIEAQQPQYNKEVVPALLEARRKYNELLDNWPKDIPALEVSNKLAELKAEERRLLSEFRGARKVGEIAPLLWLAKKVWPNGTEASCPKCGRGRHVDVEELTKWLRDGAPDCRRCGVEVTLIT